MAVVFKSSGDQDTVGILMAPPKKHRTEITQHQKQTKPQLHFKTGSTFMLLSVFPGFKHYFTAQHELPWSQRAWCASAGPCTGSHQHFLTAQPRSLSRQFDSTFHAEVLNDILRNATVQEQLQFAWVNWFPKRHRLLWQLHRQLSWQPKALSQELSRLWWLLHLHTAL